MSSAVIHSSGENRSAGRVRASSRPTVVFPEPGKPQRRISRGPAAKRWQRTHAPRIHYGLFVASPTLDLSLSDWAVLGVVAQGPTHGWPIVRMLAADGALGRVWTVGRPVVYRSMTTLTDVGLIEPAG